jgi:hypothetical protein
MLVGIGDKNNKKWNEKVNFLSILTLYLEVNM